jgi:hypothetical protein
MKTNNLEILLSAKVVKGKIVLLSSVLYLHYSSQVADFSLKWCMLMENPQNTISGSNQE